jgi:V/A-type H+/Na+-transporting ATPase subunit I
MSLARIQKVLFFARPQHQQRMMDALQASGTVHMTASEAILDENGRDFFSRSANGTDLQEQMTSLEKRVQRIETAIDVLSRYEPKAGLAARFTHERQVRSLVSFNALAEYDDSPVTASLAACAAEEQEARSKVDELQQTRGPLELLGELDLPLEHLRDTSRCFVFTFTAAANVPPSLFDEASSHLGDTGLVVALASNGDRIAAAAIGRRERQAAFAAWVDSAPISPLDLSGWAGTARENLERMAQELAALQRRIDGVRERRVALTRHLPVLREAHDYWASRLDQCKKAAFLRTSRYTEVAGGWIHSDDVPKLEARFSAQGLDIHTVAIDPAPGDEPPVEYDNAEIVRPFEFISDLYSRPRAGEMDPTPFLAGFFAFFVGLCLTDAGYGLVLAVVAFFILRHATTLTQDSRKLVRVLLYCGMVTVGVGLLTGGFFGVSPSDMPRPFAALEGLVVLNPMENQMAFLVFTLALGVIQVSFGIFLKLQWNLRHGRFAEAWLDQAPWLLILAGAVFLVLAGRVGPEWMSGAGYGALIVAATVILIFAGRETRNPFKRLGAGLFSLYQVSSLFGDVLSYVRLFALGLATGVIASVVNFIALILLDVPYVGFVFMILVLVFGHLVNLLINALGGFIHTTRLQFVEFFGKFYEGGGAPFDAFRLHTRYTTVLDPH